MGKIASAIFALIRPQADANKARYENGCKGGKPIIEKDSNRNETKPKPNDNRNET